MNELRTISVDRLEAIARHLADNTGRIEINSIERAATRRVKEAIDEEVSRRIESLAALTVHALITEFTDEAVKNARNE